MKSKYEICGSGEFISTGMWQSFIFTWPYSPRLFEPALTQTARESVAIVTLAVQLLTFIILGKAGTSLAQVLDSGFSLATILAVVSIYAVSIVGVRLPSPLLALHVQLYM
jgi:hypothetical protein